LLGPDVTLQTLTPDDPSTRCPCHDWRVARQVVTPTSIEHLVEHMFDQVFTEAERAELLECIRAWERANPDVDAAHRVTGWIDVAYDYQAQLREPARGVAPFRGRARDLGTRWARPVIT
jgi:hypothetical protein